MTEDPWELPEDTIGGRLQRYDALKAKAERQEAALREISALLPSNGTGTGGKAQAIARRALSTGEPSFADDPRVQPKPLYLNVPGEPSE